MYTRDNLESKTVRELREVCALAGIIGMSRKRKDVLVNEILKRQEGIAKKKESETVTSVEATFTSTLTKPSAQFGNRASTTIRVSCGASSGDFSVVGKTVGGTMELLKEVLNVSRMSRPLVNGKQADGDYKLRSGDILEFLKPAGRKG